MLLTSLLSPAEAGAWYCEGRPCGTTSWTCCCTAARQDFRCDQLLGRSAVEQAAASGCPRECHCVMVITPVPPRQVVTPSCFAPPPAAAVPLPAIAYLFPADTAPVLSG